MFEPVSKGWPLKGAGLDLPPFTGVESVVKLVEVETVEDGGVEGDAMVAHDRLGRGRKQAQGSDANDIDDVSETYGRPTPELSELKGNWAAIQIGSFKTAHGLVAQRRDRFVVERLGNGMTRWYVE